MQNFHVLLLFGCCFLCDIYGHCKNGGLSGYDKEILTVDHSG